MENKPKEIRAAEVTVEVKDAATGEVYRRTLPIDYVENATALRLMAEDGQGNPAQLVFYSNFAPQEAPRPHRRRAGQGPLRRPQPLKPLKEDIVPLVNLLYNSCARASNSFLK